MNRQKSIGKDATRSLHIGSSVVQDIQQTLQKSIDIHEKKVKKNAIKYSSLFINKHFKSLMRMNFTPYSGNPLSSEMKQDPDCISILYKQKFMKTNCHSVHQSTPIYRKQSKTIKQNRQSPLQFQVPQLSYVDKQNKPVKSKGCVPLLQIEELDENHKIQQLRQAKQQLTKQTLSKIKKFEGLKPYGKYPLNFDYNTKEIQIKRRKNIIAPIKFQEIKLNEEIKSIRQKNSNVKYTNLESISYIKSRIDFKERAIQYTQNLKKSRHEKIDYLKLIHHINSNLKCT